MPIGALTAALWKWTCRPGRIQNGDCITRAPEPGGSAPGSWKDATAPEWAVNVNQEPQSAATNIGSRSRLVAGAFLLFVALPILLPPQTNAAQWNVADGYDWAAVSLPAKAGEGFEAVSPEASGIRFTNALDQARSLANQIYLNGSGVAAGDVNGDGLMDVYFCGLDNSNRLFLNQGGWKFQDATETAGVACEKYACSGAILSDIDGDRDVDLLVSTVGDGVLLFLNRGDGTFHDVSPRSGLPRNKGAMSMALGDVNNDGRLDLYVANYRTDTFRDMPNTRFKLRRMNDEFNVVLVDGKPVTEPHLIGRYSASSTGRIIEHGQEDALLINRGGGRFEKLSFTGGFFLNEQNKPLAEPPYEWGLSAMFRDINQDGLADLYVCNDFMENDRVWIQRKGAMTPLNALALRKISRFSMGVDFADIDRDGLDDFIVVDMLSRDHQRHHTQFAHVAPPVGAIGEIDNRPYYVRNTLFLNRGGEHWSEIAYWAGVAATEWSWSVVFLDVDLDGYEDLLVTNGFERDAQNVDIANQLERIKSQKKLTNKEQLELRALFPRLATPNLAFRNTGEPAFEDASQRWNFQAPKISQGMALADLDNDGDMDVLINNLNEDCDVYRNISSAPRVSIRLQGDPPNTSGIGARIHVTGGPVPQSQEIISGGRYLSSDAPMRTFAAGDSDALQIEVRWPDGRISKIESASPNRLYAIRQSEAVNGELSKSGKSDGNAQTTPLFKQVGNGFEYRHQEQPFDDFARQPLLPRSFNRMGPGVCWFDVDRDGWDDLIVGSGKGGSMGVYFNDRAGGFKPIRNALYSRPVSRDQTTILCWQENGEPPRILAGSSNYEDGLAFGGAVLTYRDEERRPVDAVPAQTFSAGPLAMTDLDGDGTLELFVGGRMLPGQYPLPADSMIFKRESGRWVEDARNSQALRSAGLVSGACFSDLNIDGYPDLILAVEWGSIRVLINHEGTLRDETESWGLASFKGFWNGVAGGDFNGDGRPDLIASNWGRNTAYERFRSRPARLYFGDLGGPRQWDLMEAHYDEAMNAWVPSRRLDVVSAAFPWIAAKFGQIEHRYTRYGGSSLEELFGDRLNRAQTLDADTFETMMFLNQENRFTARPLPVEAQWSPAFAVCAADFNGDGSEDVFLSQNFFDVRPEDDRHDAGYGLLLLGDGTGSFRSVPFGESGIQIYGEQRGAAISDYDADGRPDLCVAQNGAPAVLLRNESGNPGLRVRLNGGPANPYGVGAALRAQYANNQWGPIREIQAGSGYWSQNSAIQILGRRDEIQVIEVRWPGGRTTTRKVVPGSKNLEIKMADSSD